MVAHLLLQRHVLGDAVQRDVAGALDHDLDVVAPRHLGELAQGAQLGELRLVVGIGDRARPQPVAQGEGDVVGGEDLAQLLEAGVEEVLLVMGQTPRRHDRAAAAHDARHASGRERDVAQQDPGVDGEVVDTLLGLLDDGVAVDLPGELLGPAVHFFEGLVDGHGADGHGRVAHDPFTGGVDVGPRGQVHHGVGAPTGGPGQLLDLFGHRRGHRRVPDVGVHLHEEGPPDGHGLGLGVVDVGGDDGAARRHLVAHGDGVHLLAQRHEFHLGGDLPAPARSAVG